MAKAITPPRSATSPSPDTALPAGGLTIAAYRELETSVSQLKRENTRLERRVEELSDELDETEDLLTHACELVAYWTKKSKE